jgi:hypothetical protein
MLFFDLDGVLRDLCSAAKINPTNWDCEIEGMNFIEYFDNHLSLLETAPGTEYLKPINTFIDTINVVTSQKDTWKLPTINWLKRNVPNLTTLQFDSEKIHLLKNQDILIEDYPYYSDYSKIILIDRPYNKDISVPHTRVSTPRELLDEIERRFLSGSLRFC